MNKKEDVGAFFRKHLTGLDVDWKFLKLHAEEKIRLMTNENSIMKRIIHFEEMFRMVLTVINFSVFAEEISLEMINLVIQYLILLSFSTNKQY
jgi:hypothetical protein